MPSTQPYSLFSYLIANPWRVRLIYLLGILAWLMTVYGFVRFFALDPLYWLLIGPIVFVFTAYYLLSYGINLFYKSFNMQRHRQRVRMYWERVRGYEPSVDIFLPVCGEPLEMLRKTFDGVDRIDYPNKTVYVLDDADDEGTKKLAEAFGFRYLVRPNRGVMKKAGNLKYGYEQSEGEFVVIFDADFVPHEQFIRELLPYMSDPKTAIVQSPQYFETSDDVHERSPIEFGAGHVQEDFYRIIQVSRNTFGGAICVGSNAVYRRSALDVIGGTVQIEHSEDVHTGFRLIDRGYRIEYVPLILAIGLCPSDLHAYFHQQHRWCSGSMSLLLSKSFWGSRLTVAQKLCYSSGFLYYVTHGLSLIFSFQIFLLLFRHYEWISIWNALPFIPYLVYGFAVLPMFRMTGAKPGTALARQTHNFFYGHAFVRSVFRKPLGWRATGVKSWISKEYEMILHAKGMYLVLYVFLVSLTIAMNRLPLFDLNYWTVLFWIVYTVGINGYLLYHAYRTVWDILTEERVRRSQKIGWMLAHGGPYLFLLILMPTVGLIVALIAH